MGCFSPPLKPRAGGSPTRPARRVLTGGIAVAALAGMVSCSAGMPAPESSSAPPATFSAAAPVPGPVTAEINQLRDNYGRQIIAIQLTNTTAAPVTVLGAGLASPLFSGPIDWPAAPGGVELPPGQTKILPAQLPAPECGLHSSGPPEGPSVTFQLAGAAEPGHGTAVPAADPYGVLARNNAEMCLAAAAAAVAAIQLEPDLEVSADRHSAVLHLAVTPRRTPGAVNPGSTETLTINWIDGTTLLDEDQAAPWPRSVTVHAGGAGQRFRLGVRPARCDAHALADDKVGTLLPLRVSVGGRDGVLKIDAGAPLRGRIHDFLTTACGRQ